MRRRPSLVLYAPDAPGEFLAAQGRAAADLSSGAATLLARVEAGRPLTRREAARFEKALFSAALGPARVDHQSDVYNAAKRRLRAALRPRPARG